MAIFDMFRHRNTRGDTEIKVESEILKAMLGCSVLDKKTALQIPKVSECIDAIAGTIAGLPIMLISEINGVVQYKDSDARVMMLNGETRDSMDAYQMKKSMIIDYFMGKGGFAYIDRVGNDVVGLHYVDEENISAFKNTDPIFKRGYYKLAQNNETVYPYQFIKILRNTKDGIQGKSIIEELAQALETAYNSIKTQNKIFKRDGMKKGFIEAENTLTEEAGKKLKSDWNSLYQGGDNTLLLNKGLKFTPANMSVAEMQLIEARKLLDDEITAIFHIKNTQVDTYNSAFKPIIKQLETSLNRDLLLEKEKLHHRFVIDAEEVFSATAKERYDTYNTAIKGGYMSINEARRKEHLNIIDGLDLYNLGLSSALFNPQTKQIIIPNMSQAIGVEDMDNSKIEEN